MHSLKIGGANNAGFKHMEADLKDRHGGPGGGVLRGKRDRDDRRKS